jgi:hypothetical protein
MMMSHVHDDYILLTPSEAHFADQDEDPLVVKPPPLWFHDHGVGVFPLRGKEPACASWDDYVCSRKHAAQMRQYGVRLGLLGVLDTDNREAEGWVLQQPSLETPFLVESARGIHRYYRLTGPMPKFLYRDALAIEFRNAGQYVVGPGSVHPSGKIYTARSWSWQWDDLPFFPEDFLFNDGSCPSAPSDGPFVLPEVIVEATRHDTLHKLIRSLAAHGVPLDGALMVCYAINRTRCRPPLKENRDLKSYLGRAYRQKDRTDFVRAPKTGLYLAGTLLEIGLPIDLTEAAVKSLDPAFDWESSE